MHIPYHRCDPDHRTDRPDSTAARGGLATASTLARWPLRCGILLVAGLLLLGGCQSEPEKEQPAGISGVEGNANKDANQPDTATRSLSEWDGMKSGLNLGILPGPNGERIFFSVHLPEAYFDNPDARFPLILALHPGGGNVDFYGQGVLDGLVRPALESLDPIILAPDSINGRWTSAENTQCVRHLLADAEQVLRIDRERTLVVGYSMGGQGVWHFAACMNDYFRAAIPVAGRLTKDASADIPVRAIHSRDDQTVRLGPTQSAIEKLKQENPQADIELIVLEGPSHFDREPYAKALAELKPWIEKIWSVPSDESDESKPR